MLLATAQVGSMPPMLIGAVLLAAVMHASWNALVHDAADRIAEFAVLSTLAALFGGAIVIAAGSPRAAAWPFLLTSAVLHIAYNVLLLRSYRLGDFAQVYPLARGSAPLLVVIAAALLASEGLTVTGLAGVLLISVGLGVLALPAGRGHRSDRRATAAALLTGVSIAAYTILDGLGVRRSGDVLAYAGWLFLLQGAAMPLVALVARGRAVLTQMRRYLAPGVVGGLLAVGAYTLVLWAQTRGALGPVAALRETSVVVGAVFGTVFFREPFGRRRVGASALVATGIVLLTF